MNDDIRPAERMEPDQSKRTPKVSVGLPVFNGENYLPESIESILSQDFSDFELLISDNSSTDATWQICRDYAQRDARIRLYRREKNFGANDNFQFVFYNSSAPYFMWHAHDDLLDKRYLGACYKTLENRPEYVLCTTRYTIVDENGTAKYCPFQDYTIDDRDPAERFLKYLKSLRLPGYAIYGLFRRNVLTSVLPFPNIVGSDHVLMLKMSLAGKWYQLDEPLRYYREYTNSNSISEEIERYPRAFFGSHFSVPLMPLLWEISAIINHIARTSDLRSIEKCRLALATLTMGRYKNWLYADLLHLIVAMAYRHERVWRALHAVKGRLSRIRNP